MKINSSAVAPRILGSRGTPSKFVLYALKDMYAKFGAFTRLVTIFVNFDANGLDYIGLFESKKLFGRLLLVVRITLLGFSVDGIVQSSLHVLR